MALEASGRAITTPVFLTPLMNLFGQSAPSTVDVNVSAVAALKSPSKRANRDHEEFMWRVRVRLTCDASASTNNFLLDDVHRIEPVNQVRSSRAI